MFTLIALLSLLGTPMQPDQTVPQPSKKARLIQWWQNPEMLSLFSTDPTEQTLITEEMNKFQLKLWDAQTKLKANLFKLRTSFFDLSQSNSELNDLFNANSKEHIVAIEQIKLDARLFARTYLNQEKLEKLKETAPRFFEGRWFRKNKMAVFFDEKKE